MQGVYRWAMYESGGVGSREKPYKRVIATSIRANVFRGALVELVKRRESWPT